MSKEVKQYLMDLGVVMTHSTPYHPQGNGQCERENGTIWRAVRMALKSLGAPENQWESVLDTVLHSIRSLLCTATNETPHERLFSFPRKTSNGYSLPTWLSQPGRVLVRKFVRESKTDPVVEPVDLISATPHYARIRHPNGRETTVSTKDLAPAGTEPLPTEAPPGDDSAKALPLLSPDAPEPPKLHSSPPSLLSPTPMPRSPSVPEKSPCKPEPSNKDETVPKPLRRSSRITKPVDRLNYSN